ncbi:MAG: hypothetical protein M1831_004906 [Alyxoria varia]|nr:MAG: hypothetical protein M1831_004906 [Alyxoria varia]
MDELDDPMDEEVAETQACGWTPPPRDVFSGETIAITAEGHEVKVGKVSREVESSTFILPKRLIAHFNEEKLELARRSKGWLPWLRNKEVTFTRFSSNAFEIIAYWFTDGRLRHKTKHPNLGGGLPPQMSDKANHAGESEMSPNFGELAVAWMFGFEEGIPALMNDAISMIYEIAKEVKEPEGGWDEVLGVYENAPAGSGLRRLLVELFVLHPTCEQEMIAVAQRWPIQLSEDIRARRGKNRENQGAEGLADSFDVAWSKLNVCDFHEHGEQRSTARASSVSSGGVSDIRVPPLGSPFETPPRHTSPLRDLNQRRRNIPHHSKQPRTTPRMPITILVFFWRRPDLSHIQFKRQLELGYLPVLQRLAWDVFPGCYSRQYAQQDAEGDLDTDAQQTPAVEPQPMGFDALAVMMFANEGAMRAFQQRVEQGSGAETIKSEEMKFVDRGKTRVVYVDESWMTGR